MKKLELNTFQLEQLAEGNVTLDTQKAAKTALRPGVVVLLSRALAPWELGVGSEVNPSKVFDSTGDQISSGTADHDQVRVMAAAPEALALLREMVDDPAWAWGDKSGQVEALLRKAGWL